MTARMRRLASDWEQVRKDFAGHKNIRVTPVGPEPPEKYMVTYFVNGIHLLPDGRIETLGRHEVEITLHAEYPRYKPICRILTPIYHPNFRDGQICIGDIWGAGESLSDIIINIGDMIQYKSWNASSPLSADAAQWAMENKHLFPVGNLNLYIADYASAKDTVEIDLLEEEAPAAPAAPAAPVTQTSLIEKRRAEAAEAIPEPEPLPEPEPQVPLNDFEITAEELAGVTYVPTAERMQTVSQNRLQAKGGVNFKTVIVKGLLWALLGALLGFLLSEFTDKNLTSHASAAELSGHGGLVDYFEARAKADEALDFVNDEFEAWCKENDVDSEDDDALEQYFASDDVSDEVMEKLEEYLEYDDEASENLYDAYVDDYDSDEDDLEDAVKTVVRTKTGLWSAVIAMMVGLCLGIGEGVFYGSAEKAIKYGLIGAAISLVLGYLSGYAAQYMYAELLEDDPEGLTAALVRGAGWAIMGLGAGLAIGLIKPQGKRIAFCALGGTVGAFLGGFLFNYVTDIIPDDTVARGVAIGVMGILIGLGVGLLEQFAKSAWLKVIRGEFEGKEYLVFTGTTSIGNNAKNTIVLFKDKLVGPHHCDIKLEGNRYVLVDCGTPMGTVVNGRRTPRHVLRQGDSIAIGNSVLVFNTK